MNWKAINGDSGTSNCVNYFMKTPEVKVRCKYCGSKEDVDWIMELDKFLCYECFAKLHNKKSDDYKFNK